MTLDIIWLVAVGLNLIMALVRNEWELAGAWFVAGLAVTVILMKP